MTRYLFLLALCTLSLQAPRAATIYMAPDGNDSNDGSENKPIKTGDEADERLKPGDTLILKSGTYNGKLHIRANGTEQNRITIKSASSDPAIFDSNKAPGQPVRLEGDYITIEGVEGRNGGDVCFSIEGDHIDAERISVRDCPSHGINIRGKYISVAHAVVTNASTSNTGTQNSGWASGLKVSQGAEHVTLFRNLVHDNWGEGIAVTKGKHVVVEGNHSYDNWAVNLYIDNAVDVQVVGNLLHCDFSKGIVSGRDTAGIAIGEEEYDGWGAQLADITVMNNLVSDCHYGIVGYESDVSGGGFLRVNIVGNTFWNSKKRGISIQIGDNSQTKTEDSLVAGNIFHTSDATKSGGYIDDENADIVFRNNLWAGKKPSEWDHVLGDDDIFGDPKFLATPAKTAMSFRLADDSPALGAGYAQSFLDEDFAGTTRPSEPAIGGLEYVAVGAASPFDDDFGAGEPSDVSPPSDEAEEGDDPDAPSGSADGGDGASEGGNDGGAGADDVDDSVYGSNDEDDDQGAPDYASSSPPSGGAGVVSGANGTPQASGTNGAGLDNQDGAVGSDTAGNIDSSQTGMQNGGGTQEAGALTATTGNEASADSSIQSNAGCGILRADKEEANRTWAAPGLLLTLLLWGAARGVLRRRKSL